MFIEINTLNFIVVVISDNFGLSLYDCEDHQFLQFDRSGLMKCFVTTYSKNLMILFENGNGRGGAFMFYEIKIKF